MPVDESRDVLSNPVFLRTVLDELCEPLACLDCRGRISFANLPMQRYLQECGCQEEECNLLGCIHPEERVAFCAWLDDPEPRSKGIHLRICSGGSRWEHIICRSYPFQGGRVVKFSSVPENDPEMAELLMMSEPVFRKVFQYLPDFVLLIQNGRVVNVNNSSRILLGLDPKQDDVFPEGLFLDSRWILDSMQARETFLPDVGLVAKNGDIFHCDLCMMHFDNPQGTTVLMVMHDRSEVDAVRRNFNIEHSRYRTLFENMQTGMAEQRVVYGKDGSVVDLEYVDVNPAFEVQTGLPKSVIGKGILTVMPNFEDFWFDMFVRVALSGKSEYAENYVADVDRWFSVFVFSTGEEKVAQIFLDISSQKRMEHELMESLREREALLKEVHHRVHNNLQTIKGVIGIQQMKMEDGPARQSLRQAESRIQAIGQVHQSLYSSERLSSICLGEHIRNMVRELAAEFDLFIDLDMEEQGEVQFVDMDQGIAISLVMNELLTNTFKFAIGEGKAGRIKMEITARKDGFSMVYQDFGPGYPEDPWESKGSALGLSLVHNLVQKQLKGTLVLCNRNGARVEIYIPVDANQRPR
ncbi:MAG: histidine kinase dimerization/phosphoacceptor domain -containing protein [Candidatus Methanomethylophilaceae archaeon]